ncbi:MAG: hypothetical protein JO154_14590 [Chitinophaga sp.]|uniref:hypothetical protein n=1 Tax=Chitinophaga sp. TaxID=1869181 RepID=UPI0025B9D372|nr:hypothetical protein [Chitinophaga sp.]MBV8253828.1 hypothetical protein [Chitinophaga sp.]
MPLRDVRHFIDFLLREECPQSLSAGADRAPYSVSVLCYPDFLVSGFSYVSENNPVIARLPADPGNSAVITVTTR